MYLNSHQFLTGQVSKRCGPSCCISNVAAYQYTSSCMRPLTVKHADIPIKRRDIDPDTFGLDPLTQCPAATKLPLHALIVPSPALHTVVHMSVGNACALTVVTCMQHMHVALRDSLRRQNTLEPGIQSIHDCTGILHSDTTCVLCPIRHILDA